MEIIELKNPNALMVPEIYRLLERALSSIEHLAPGGLNSVAQDLINFVRLDGHYLILGAEDGAFKAVVMASLPGSQLFPYPIIHLGYNEGSKALHKAIADFTLDKLVQEGYTKIWTLNGSRVRDEVWLRAFKNARVEPKFMGGAYLFEVK